ncbi:hypothetical protein LSTR_LSTR012953 [Laodelphax striatellus]|uniref:HTH psq-type domain-containing protein n=1 Tax=Laodelphax striatellus TaxID=195883 RepID=A0A482X1Y0_LAOST|nr:hypothetical protein LSTR_LSTR012953 [Laodelphax striatellus]
MSSAVSRAALRGPRRRSQTHRLSHAHSQKKRIGLRQDRRMMEEKYNTTTMNKWICTWSCFAWLSAYVLPVLGGGEGLREGTKQERLRQNESSTEKEEGIKKKTKKLIKSSYRVFFYLQLLLARSVLNCAPIGRRLSRLPVGGILASERLIEETLCSINIKNTTCSSSGKPHTDPVAYLKKCCVVHQFVRNILPRNPQHLLQVELTGSVEGLNYKKVFVVDPYFQRIFSETPCKHPVIVLKDLRGWEVQAIVDFMYRGEISVGQEQLSPLIKAAESLKVRVLAHTERIPMCPAEKENQNPAPCFSPFSQQPPPPPAQGGTTVSPHFEAGPPPPLRLPQLPHMPHISFTDVDRHCNSPLPRRKQARPRRRSGDTSCGAQDLSKCPPTSPMETDMAENLSMKKPHNSSHQPQNNSSSNNNNNNSTSNNNNSNNHTLPPNRPSSTPTPPSHLNPLKVESDDSDAGDSVSQPVELTTSGGGGGGSNALTLAAVAAASREHEHRERERERERQERERERERANDYTTNSSEPFSLPPPHHITGLQDPLENSFPHLASISALSLTPPHRLFPGMESCRNSLLNDIPEVRNENHHISVKKKRGGKYDVVPSVGRPKGQHSAPRGGPPRSWTNAELTEALQHVWNKKMTTSQASRIFGIPYNSLLMYVRGKYGKSLKLEQLKKECFGDLGGPLDLLGLGPLASNNNNPTKPHKGPEPDLMLGPPGFNPSQYPPTSFYPDFGAPFPVPVGMVHLLPQSEKNREQSGPIDYAKDEMSAQRNDIDYTKDSDPNLRNSPMALDFAKDDSGIHHSSLKEEDDDECRKSPAVRHLDESQQQNGQD